MGPVSARRQRHNNPGRRLSRRALDVLRGEATTILAFYEFGNFVWKEHVLRKCISQQEAQELLEAFKGALGLMDVFYPDLREDLPGICELAARTGLTFYDASYLYVALKEGLALVAEGSELAERARELGVAC